MLGQAKQAVHGNLDKNALNLSGWFCYTEACYHQLQRTLLPHASTIVTAVAVDVSALLLLHLMLLCYCSNLLPTNFAAAIASEQQLQRAATAA